MSILKDIPELIQAEVITEETAAKIQEYYKAKGGSLTNKLFIVFGILGACLVGLGIILILAHNWDELPKMIKLVFAFVPLIIGQALCGHALFRQAESVAWRETTATFLFLSIGACIALVSQIYNIPGNLNSFVLTWMVVALLLVYVMRSSIASMFYIIGITYYGFNTGYWTYPKSESYIYWGLLLLVLPFYYYLTQKKSKSNFLTFHNWLIPASVTLVLGTVATNAEELMMIAYMSLFGLLYLIGDLPFFADRKLRNNGFKIFGAVGTMVLLLGLSFDWYWMDLSKFENISSDMIGTPEFFAAIILTILAIVLLVQYAKRREPDDFKPVAITFLLFIGTFFVGLFTPAAAVIINIYVFVLGLLTIRIGTQQNHLGILNYGLLTIAALVTCRFFDTDISFFFRGVLFIAVGCGFFAANYFMLQKRKTNELS